jgi:phosphoribosyl 1,2-cyclic phosphodiesterase
VSSSEKPLPCEFAVRYWGTRGSIPSPKTPTAFRDRIRETLEGFRSDALSDLNRLKSPNAVETYLADLPVWRTSGYGGDTSCVQIEGAAEPMVIDAGSGIRRLGEVLMGGPFSQGKGTLHLFFTHFHWDHIIGLPFFQPIFIRGNHIHIYAVQDDAESCVRQLFQRPFFPVSYDQLGAKFHFHKLEPRKPLSVQGFSWTPYQLDHPDPCWGFRVERETKKGKKTYAHCVDTEATRVSPADLGEDVYLYRDADLCYFDAQYTASEMLSYMNWGHSAAPIGIEIALREGVREILFAHHDPSSSDEKIFAAEQQTADFLHSYRLAAQNGGRTLPGLKWSFARDGDRIVLGAL